MVEEQRAPLGASQVISRAALLGAGAGLLVALGDFGSLWLWLPLWSDRAWLLGRLVGTLPPMGAALGALLGILGSVGGAGTRALAARMARDATRRDVWARRLWPLPFVLALTPLLVVVARLLFSGGKMSRLPATGLLSTAVAAVLVVGAWISLRVARGAFDRARALSGDRARWLAGGALVGHLALGKVDQTVLPNLYQYLHACLALASWLLAGAGLALLFGASRAARRVDKRVPSLGLYVAAALVGLFVANAMTMESNQNVRVALFDPRAATSRSAMHALEPMLVLASRSGVRPRNSHATTFAAHKLDPALYRGLHTDPGAHVLLITIDALRADHVGAWGYARRLTPNLNRLAAESVVYERRYAQAPHSSYSICSLMTSEYLHETLDLGQPPPEATLASVLAEAGYHTAAFYTLGIFHTEGERLTTYQHDALGFALHDHTDRPASETTNRILEEIDRLVERGSPRSFIWAHYFDVHEPYDDTSIGTAEVDRYDGEIRTTDRAVGRLIREARRRLGPNVVVAVTADHGEEFRDHGGVYHGSSVYEEQIRVPLIVSAPGFAPRRVTAPVELVDLAPTLLGIVDVPAAASMRGTDLRPLAVGRVADAGPVYAAVIHKRMVVSWPYKLVADLRFGIFELYDLAHDPHERRNLADSDRPRADALRGDLYAWLDSLAAPAGSHDAGDPRQMAIDRGRLGDRRSVTALAAVLLDGSAPREMRCEAGRILGRLADMRAASALERGIHDPDQLVAAEAAIALGRMYDPRAREALRSLVFSEDPDIRARAAVSLGRLRDRRAVPSLIEALWVAPTTYEREEAVRWLGRLRDPSAVEPLLSMLPEFRTRSLVVVALGQIGDHRAYGTLADMLDWERHSDVRDAVVRGLGLLGDRRAAPRLAAIAATDLDLTNVPESLVRLDAIENGVIGGTDVHEGVPGARGFARCLAGPIFHDWDYQHRTYCVGASAQVSLDLSIPTAVGSAAGGALVLLTARRTDSGSPTMVSVRIGARELSSERIDGKWVELRWTLSASDLATGHLPAIVRTEDPRGRLAIDHLLIVPTPATVAVAAP